MSYILDALKKAERERGLARVPNLGSVHAELPERGRGRWVALAIGGTALFALLWAFYPRGREGVTPPPEPRAQEAPPEAPLREARAVSAPEAVAAPYRESRISSPPPVSSREQGAPASALPGAPASALPTAAETGAPAFAPPRIAAAPPARTDVPASAGGRETPEPAPEPGLRDAVAGMVLSVHMFSERPADRLVFINGRRYVEGDLVERRFRLESITPEGAVLSFGAEREFLRPGN